VAGIGYGGQRLSKSGLNLIKIAEDVGLVDALSAERVATKTDTTPKLILLDIHTGLGPKGTKRDILLIQIKVIMF